MGMSSRGSLSAIASDVGGLINYVELLVTGKGGASKTGKPLEHLKQVNHWEINFF